MDERTKREARATGPRSECWHVLAGPFTRAGRLRAFIAAVSDIEGVSEVVAERFRCGVLTLTLRYAGGRPLADCLTALAEFAPRVETAGSGTLRLRLSDVPPDS